MNKLVQSGDFITNSIIAVFAIFQGILYFAEKRRNTFANKDDFKNACPLYSHLLNHAEKYFSIIIVIFGIGLILQYLKLKGFP